MTTSSSSAQAGGFISAPILSPPPSSTATSSIAASTLPKPRQHPLRSGGSKESSFINYVDSGIQQVQRRYAKKFDDAEAGEDVKGYVSFKEAAKDIERLVDVVWVSGTPSLQIPYLLSLALLAVTLLPSFPPAPRTTFRLLQKLDLAFASLIEGKDPDTGEAMPGMETSTKSGVSGTQKVRIKSIVERTRLAVVELMNAGEYEDEQDEETSDENDIDGDYDASTSLEMEVARVYDMTIMELGDVIGQQSIGILDEAEGETE